MAPEADPTNPEHHNHMQRCLGLAGSIQIQWIGPPGQLLSSTIRTRNPWPQGRIQRTRKIIHMLSEVSGAFLWPRFLDLARLEDPHWIRAWHAILRFSQRIQGTENSSTTGLSLSYLETSFVAARTMETNMPSFFFSWHVSDLDLSLCYHQNDCWKCAGFACAG